MNNTDRLEVLKHSFAILEGLAKDINDKIKDAKEGVRESNQNLIMGSLYGLEETADKIKNVHAVMKYLHSQTR